MRTAFRHPLETGEGNFDCDKIYKYRPNYGGPDLPGRLKNQAFTAAAISCWCCTGFADLFFKISFSTIMTTLRIK